MITVIFSTYNGEWTLNNTLSSLCRLLPPEGGWKLVAVDNGSTDKSLDILTSFRYRLPLTILQQPVRGKNAALNLALGHVEGDLVVFTDDDVIAHEAWLQAFRTAADVHPDYAVFGGAISACWPTPPEDWILRIVPLGVTYALTPVHREDGPIDPGDVWGPSMAVRVSVFKAGYRFNTAIGPAAGSYAMGSETEFSRRVHAQGYLSWFVAQAAVQHQIRTNQLTKKWIRSRALRAGRGDAAIAESTSTQLLGMPRWAFRKVIREACGAVWNSLQTNPDQAFKHVCALYHTLGYMAQHRASRRPRIAFLRIAPLQARSRRL